jgi:hypothetical protein
MNCERVSLPIPVKLMRKKRPYANVFDSLEDEAIRAQFDEEFSDHRRPTNEEVTVP